MFEVIGSIADILGVVGGIFAVLAWLKARQLQQEAAAERERLTQPVKVTLRLADNSREITLPMELRRAELTRAELLGRLGMMPMAKP